ncbi:hypothetical protein C4D60_Mb05t09750 [Musa balbisiana]|uniref:Nuclear cap-binding protein subunit 1 n=1 Tax=Musa balbisiana TaxID=52838 RepID=A0A4S8JUX4_MUSBA|nr:hypothetical protein C4D60_Mb05t09750 [Musa balbisiana]
MSSWRTLLLRVGDKCPEYGGAVDYKEHIETCYGVLWREFEHSKDEISEVGLINLEDEDFGKNIVDDLHCKLQEALSSENCDKIRTLMRFLTVLMCSKVILPSSVIEVFETLLSSAATIIDEDAGNPSWQPCADFYITCILSCLPWGGTELIEQVPDEFDRVIVGIQSYLSIRKHSQDTSFIVFEADEDKSAKEKDFVEDLWDHIQILSTNGWKVDSVPRPHLSFEEQLVSGKSYNLSPISCPKQSTSSSRSTISRERENYEAKLKYPQRLRRLHIFPSNKIEKMQPIDRFIVEDRKECASYMASLPVPFRYEYLMAETIFSQIMFLPQPPFKPIYYALVIIDLCKALPGAFPAVVAGAVRSLFNRIGDLDMECRTRLILWFSHHLSNFQYFWPWEEWAHVKDLPRWAPQRVFVQEVLEREVRLSYWDKIKQFAIEVVIQTLLDIGSKSFTHLITVLERYGQVIAKLCTDQNMQVLLIDEVSSYWKNNTQMTAIAIDRMMGYRIISNLAIVSWVFSFSNIEQFHVSDRPWEILRNAINKTYNRIADLRKEIQTLKRVFC